MAKCRLFMSYPAHYVHTVDIMFSAWFLVLLFFSNAQGPSSTPPSQSCSVLCGYNDWVGLANCSNRVLLRVPDSCSHARTLRLTGNQIKHLPENSFQNFVNLRFLYLTNNNLTDIQPNAFKGLEGSLEFVNLDGNCFSDVTQDIVHGFQKVMFLLVRGGCIERIEERAFREVRDLSEIDLHGNMLETPPCNAFNPENKVVKLTLSNNLIRYLPNSCFSDLSNLEDLILDGNNLTDIRNSNALGGLQTLQNLSLGRTSLIRIPVNIFQEIRNILSLSMARNKIRSIPANAFAILKKLTSLNLRENGIHRLTASVFRNNGQLELLDLSENKITMIESGTFSPLSKLRRLYLASNRLTSMLGTLSYTQWSAFEQISLAENPLLCECAILSLTSWLNQNPEYASSPEGRATCRTPDGFTTHVILIAGKMSCLPVNDETTGPRKSARLSLPLRPADVTGTVMGQTISLKYSPLSTIFSHKTLSLVLDPAIQEHFPPAFVQTKSPETALFNKSEMNTSTTVIIVLTAMLFLAAIILCSCIIKQWCKNLRREEDDCPRKRHHDLCYNSTHTTRVSVVPSGGSVSSDARESGLTPIPLQGDQGGDAKDVEIKDEGEDGCDLYETLPEDGIRMNIPYSVTDTMSYTSAGIGSPSGISIQGSDVMSDTRNLNSKLMEEHMDVNGYVSKDLFFPPTPVYHSRIATRGGGNVSMATPV